MENTLWVVPGPARICQGLVAQGVPTELWGDRAGVAPLW